MATQTLSEATIASTVRNTLRASMHPDTLAAIADSYLRDAQRMATIQFEDLHGFAPGYAEIARRIRVACRTCYGEQRIIVNYQYAPCPDCAS